MLIPGLEGMFTLAVDHLPLSSRALALVPFFFFGTWAVGVWLLSWSAGIWKRSILIPGGFLLGFSFASLFLNATATLLGWYTGLFLWCVIGGICLFRAVRIIHESEGDADWTAMLRAWRWLIPAIVLLGISSHVFDNTAHFGFQTLIARGWWPLPFIYEPSQALVYHYGFDVVAAPFVTFGIPAPFGSIFWVMMLQLALLSFAFVVVGGWVRSRASRWWIVATWALVESFGWILRPFRSILPDVFQQLSPFYSSVSHGVLVTSYGRSFIPAFACVLFLLWWSRSDISRRWRQLIPLFVLMTASALSSETLFVALLPFLAMGVLATLPSWRARVWVTVTLCVVVAAAAIQGGLLTEAFWSHVGLSALDASQAVETSFHLRNGWSMAIFGGETLDLRTPSAWARLAFEMGAQLVLFVAAFVAWKRWDAFTRWALVGAATSFLMGFLFYYDATSVNILRFFQHAFFVTSLFGAIVLVPPMLSRIGGRIAYGLLMFGGVACVLFYTVLSNMPFIPLFDPAPPFSTSPALWTPLLRQDSLPRGSVVWVSEPRRPDGFPPETTAQVPVIFGVPIRHCAAFSLRDIDARCDEFYQVPSAERLQRLGATHLLLTPDWIQAHGQEPWFARLEEIEHYTVPEWSSLTPSWWRTDLRPWTLYRVPSYETDSSAL